MCLHEQYANDISLKERFTVILPIFIDEHTDYRKNLRNKETHV